MIIYYTIHSSWLLSQSNIYCQWWHHCHIGQLFLVIKKKSTIFLTVFLNFKLIESKNWFCILKELKWMSNNGEPYNRRQPSSCNNSHHGSDSTISQQKNSNSRLIFIDKKLVLKIKFVFYFSNHHLLQFLSLYQ